MSGGLYYLITSVKEDMDQHGIALNIEVTCTYSRKHGILGMGHGLLALRRLLIPHPLKKY